MPVDFSVRGHGDLKRLGAMLRDNKPLQKEVLRAINTATEPIKVDIAAEARRILPKAGGLAEIVADAKIATRTRLWGNYVGVRIVAEQTKTKSTALRRRAIARRTGRKTTRGITLKNYSDGPVDLASINRGYTWHPTWGHKPRIRQQLRRGFFSNPIRTLGARRVKNNVVGVVHTYLERLASAASGGRRPAA